MFNSGIVIAEHIPLKQGLRREAAGLLGAFLGNRRAYSIKTRIKTPSYRADLTLRRWIAEHIPLKQGLRPTTRKNFWEPAPKIAEHIPLKQGLRHNLSVRPIFVLDRRAYSIKTRIKTFDWLEISRRAYSIKTKD